MASGGGVLVVKHSLSPVVSSLVVGLTLTEYGPLLGRAGTVYSQTRGAVAVATGTVESGVSPGGSGG